VKLPVLMIFLLLVPVLSDVSVVRTVANPTAKGQMTTTFELSADSPSAVDLVELMPIGWKVQDWKVTGCEKEDVAFEEQATRIYNGSTFAAYHWKFSKPVLTAKLSYSTVPQSVGNFTFIAVWIFPDGFKQEAKTVEIKEGLLSEVSNNLGFALLAAAVVLAFLILLKFRKPTRKKSKTRKTR